MSHTRTEQRVYVLQPDRLFYYCLTALGQMRARIDAHDHQRGTIAATIGRGLLAPSGELVVTLAPLDAGRTTLVATYRALAWGGDRRALATFLEALDALVSRA